MLNKKANERHFNHILKNPLSEPRRAMAEAYVKGAFTAEDRDAVIKQLAAPLSRGEKRAFSQELELAEAFASSGKMIDSPDLQSEAHQLLWSAHWLYALKNPEAAEISSDHFQRGLARAYSAKQELMTHALHLSRAGVNTDTKLKFGAPGSLFYFDPAENEINIDLMFSLMQGFEHTRGAIFHEIGHSQLTVKFPERMQELRSEMETITEQAKITKPTPEQNKEFQKLNTHWHLWMRLFDEAENSPVNRFATDMGTKLAQDYGLSLNNIEASLADVVAYKTKPDTEDTPTNRFHNLMNVVRMSFYQGNEYFDDKPDEWAKIGGARIDWLEGLPKEEGGKPVKGEEALAELRELCSGPEGLENLQPAAMDRMRGADWLAHVAEDCQAKRHAVIEEIWDRYAGPLAEKILEQQEQSQGQGQQDGGDQSGGTQGQSQDSGQGQSGGGGGGMPDMSLPPQTPQEQSQQSREFADDLPPPEEPQDSQQEQDQQQSQSEGQSEGEGQGQGGEQEQENSEPTPPEDEKQESEPLPEQEQNEGQSEGEGQGQGKGKGEGEEAGQDDSELAEASHSEDEQDLNASSPEAQTIEALLEEMAEDQAIEQTAREQEDYQSSPSISNALGGGRGAGASKRDSRAKVGDWTDYDASCREFADEISDVRRMLETIQERQSQRHNKPSARRSLLPDDGDLDRLDPETHQDFVKKLLMGDDITERDASRFIEDKEEHTPSSIELVVLTDGSGSMYWGGEAGPIQAGLHAACIFNEGARQLAERRQQQGAKIGQQEGSVDVYVGLWGNNPPLILAQPGDDPQKVGAAIAGIKDPQGWGTSLAPAIRHTTRTLSERKARPNMPIGYTHFVIVSDGDIEDEHAARATMEKLCENCPQTTIDVAIVNTDHSPMEQLVKSLQGKYGESRIGIVRESTPQKAVASLLDLFEARADMTAHSKAIPFSQKQKAMIQAHESMGRG